MFVSAAHPQSQLFKQQRGPSEYDSLPTTSVSVLTDYDLCFVVTCQTIAVFMRFRQQLLRHIWEKVLHWVRITSFSLVIYSNVSHVTFVQQFFHFLPGVDGYGCFCYAAAYNMNVSPFYV